MKKEQSTAVFILELDSPTLECDVTRGIDMKLTNAVMYAQKFLQNVEKTRARLILLKTIGSCDKFQTKRAATKNERCTI